jgi:hypothetical protein
MSFVPPEDIPTWIPASTLIWLAMSVWRGWRRGVIRQGVSLLALIGAICAAIYAGPLLAPAIPALGFPVFLRPLVAGALIILLIWGTIATVSSIIFRKTDEQEVGLVRMTYGLGGAFLGLLLGLLLLGVCGWGVRIAGSLADGLQTGAKVKSTAKGLPPPVPAETRALPSLKKIIEESPLSEWFAKADPITPEWYPRLVKIGRILASPAASERLFADPAFANVARNSHLASIRSDPVLQEAIRSGDLWTLLRSPKVRAAAADTQLQTTMSLLDVDRAIERALHPQNTPPPPRAGEPRRAKP